VALRKNLRKFDAFAAVSAPAAAFAKETFGIECTVIPIGIDLEAFRRIPERSPLHLTLAFLGRLVERKGVLELLEALPLLEQDLLDRLDVRIGGRGPLLTEAENAVLRNDLADVVTFDGFVSEADKPQFLADADIAVFPATGGESFGIVLIEAMAAGAGVVLAGANPGYLSVIGDRPEVSVDATDTAAFAAALTRLVEDATLREELHAEQQERVQGFDLQVVGKRVVRELYAL
jgi:phosphatidylinositol alpha-mannosyltransferase